MGRKKPGPGLDIQTMGSFQREENRDREGVESSGAVETSQRETRQGGSSTAQETLGKARGQEEEQRSEAECCGKLELPERQNFRDLEKSNHGFDFWRNRGSEAVRCLPEHSSCPPPPLQGSSIFLGLLSLLSPQLAPPCLLSYCITAFLRRVIWFCSYVMTCTSSIFHSFFFFSFFFSHSFILSFFLLLPPLLSPVYYQASAKYHLRSCWV